MKRLSILLILSLLIIVPLAYAGAWDSREVKISEGSGDAVGPFFIRVDEVDEATKSAYISIEKDGQVIGADIVTARKPLIIPQKIKVGIIGFSNFYNYGKVVRLDVSPYVDAKIESYRIPTVFSWTSGTFYNAYLFIKNTGVMSTNFKVELSQEGAYNKQRDDYILENGEHVSKILKITKPIIYDTVNSGETNKIVYDYISATERQHTGSFADDMNEKARYVFRLYHKDQLLDEVYTPTIMKTTTQTGFIQELNVPSVMYANTEYEAEAKMMNGGKASGNNENAKFNLELRTKGFELRPSNSNRAGNVGGSDPIISIYPNLLRGYLDQYRIRDWDFAIVPHVPEGRYNLLFILSIQDVGRGYNQELDRIVVPVTVKKGYAVKIEKVRLPSDIKFGQYVPVTVTLKNFGVGITASLELTSPILEETQKKMIQVPGFTSMDTDFFVTATGSGIVPLNLLLKTHIVEGGKNIDPSGGNNFYLDAKTVKMNIIMPQLEPEIDESKQEPYVPIVEPVKPVLKEPEQMETKVEIKSVEEPKIVNEEFIPQTQLLNIPKPSIDVLPFLFLAAAVIIFLVGLRMVWSTREKDEPTEVVHVQMPAQEKKIRNSKKKKV